MTKINNLAKLKFQINKTEDTLAITNNYVLVSPEIGFCAVNFQILTQNSWPGYKQMHFVNLFISFGPRVLRK